MGEAQNQTIRLLSYNIHGCVGRGGREDPEGILQIIRDADADFVALQEVQDSDEADRSFLRGVEKLPYAQIVYGRTMQKPLGPYGNLLLSKHPLCSITCREISFKKREPRGIIDAWSNAYARPLHLMSTHLGLQRRERILHIRQLLELRFRSAAEKPGAVHILLGDMNEWLTTSRLSRSLHDAYDNSSTIRTFPSRMPLFALDRILVNGAIQDIRFSRIESLQARIVSDHLPLLAELTLG